MNVVYADPLDEDISMHYNRLLNLQIEYQMLQNNVLRELQNGSVAMNYPIVKTNQLALNFQHMKSALTDQPKLI